MALVRVVPRTKLRACIYGGAPCLTELSCSDAPGQCPTSADQQLDQCPGWAWPVSDQCFDGCEAGSGPPELVVQGQVMCRP
jgi:hypothetical protein